jgi:DNA-directed RNA polymerase specialized sigma24 family protein
LLLNHSEQQTAALLHVRPGTVKSRLSRAITQLSTSLAHLDPQEPHS